MGLNENVTALARRIATEFKTVRSELSTGLTGKVGTDDARLNDARTPTAHTHVAADLSNSTATGRSVITATDAAAARTAIGAGTSSLVIGTTSTSAKAGDYAPPADAAATTASLRTLGTGATQAAAGNDARLSDARTPTSHTHAASQVSDATTVGRSVMTAVDAAAARTAIGAGTGSSNLVIGTTSTTAKAGDYAPPSDAVATTASLRTLGTGAQQAAVGNHTHTAASVGAAAASHTHPASDLTATGTRDATTFLRGDNTWAVPPGGGGGGTWVAFTPTWTAVNGAPALGNGTLTGRYVKLGNIVWLYVRLSLGSTTNGSAGSWGFGNLPFASANLGESELICKGWTAGGNYGGIAWIPPGTTNLNPMLPNGSNDCRLSTVQNANSTGASGTGVPLVGGAYSFGNGHNLIISGFYESA